MQTLDVSSRLCSPHFEWVRGVLKRAFDIALAALGLLTFSPLLLCVALWVKLDSPGPVLFRQERVGRAGRVFRIHKFRTMQQDAPSHGLALTVGRDVRITPAGQTLRRYRLDELPQLWDVLKGDMSLVGPRPEVPRYVAHYPTALRERVLAVRPGITDPAALAHLDEASLLAQAVDPEREYIEVILPKKLATQAAYAEHATLASDLRVIAQTFVKLVMR